MDPNFTDRSALFNFNWVADEVIAGSSKPYFSEQFNFLHNERIKVIINLTKDPLIKTDQLDKFTIYNIPISDFSIPTYEQINEFWQICKKHEKRNEAILVHCMAGCGRTGTMLAIWLLLKGVVQTGEEAVDQIRLLRPCSVETMEQENLILEIILSAIK